jgi:hypothetical protein
MPGLPRLLGLDVDGIGLNQSVYLIEEFLHVKIMIKMMSQPMTIPFPFSTSNAPLLSFCF